MKRALLYLLLVFLSGCEKTESEILQQGVIDEMGWLYKADPLEDYEDAVKKKDYRFLGLYGYSTYVPGVSVKCLDRDKDIKPIKGTSDAVLGYEHAKLIAIAQTYAKDYNFRMRLYLEENNGFKCNS